MSSIKMIVGLRNPGSDYARTRHNVGSWFVEELARIEACGFKLDKKSQSEVAMFVANQTNRYLLLPLTFMNHSGTAVRLVSEYYRIQPSEILIAHDDLDLSVGRIQLKTGGGHGGHNGLRDVISQLGSASFHRLRIGIGRPDMQDKVLDYVLGNPSKHDKQQIDSVIEKAIMATPLLLKGQLAAVMNQLN